MAFFTNHFSKKFPFGACVAVDAASAAAAVRHLVCFSAVRFTIKALHVSIACSLIRFSLCLSLSLDSPVVLRGVTGRVLARNFTVALENWCGVGGLRISFCI